MTNQFGFSWTEVFLGQAQISQEQLVTLQQHRGVPTAARLCQDLGGWHRASHFTSIGVCDLVYKRGGGVFSSVCIPQSASISEHLCPKRPCSSRSSRGGSREEKYCALVRRDSFSLYQFYVRIGFMWC